MTDRVFGIGLSRTGTMSLGRALDMLGIPTVHYPHDRATLVELQAGDGRLSVLDSYRAIVDITVAPFYRRLDQSWPESKFVLTIRDKSSWLRSMARHLENLAAVWDWLDPEFREFTVFIVEQMYGTDRDPSRARAQADASAAPTFEVGRFAAAFDRHHQAVLEYFRGRHADLLVFELVDGAGWGPLCDFLGLPVPAVPFPHSNRGRGDQLGREEASVWAARCRGARRRLDHLVPSGSTVVLVDDGELPPPAPERHVELPFLERNGRPWGRPATDEVAIAELERMREAGADLVVFAASAMWWLGHYTGFAIHLRSRYACLVDDDDLVAFDLRAGA